MARIPMAIQNPGGNSGNVKLLPFLPLSLLSVFFRRCRRCWSFDQRPYRGWESPTVLVVDAGENTCIGEMKIPSSALYRPGMGDVR